MPTTVENKEPKGRILLVENSRLISQEMKTVLVADGYVIAGVMHTGEKAIDAAKELLPDIILMNIALDGEMDGITAAERIRAERDVPVIFVTGYADDEFIARAKLTRPCGYILKPISPRELLIAVELSLYCHRVDEQLRISISLRNELEREILGISENERRAIGADLHDGLGQELTGISYLSQRLANLLKRKDLPEAADAQEILRMVSHSIEIVRNLSHGITPQLLAETGLVAALAKYSSGIKDRHRVQCKVVADECDLHLSEIVALQLFRIAQEAALNVIKHAAATEITIKLYILDSFLMLEVSDDGIGIDQEKLRFNAGHGMGILRYRAKAIGGSLEFVTAEPSGLMVRCRLPLSAVDSSSKPPPKIGLQGKDHE